METGWGATAHDECDTSVSLSDDEKSRLLQYVGDNTQWDAPGGDDLRDLKSMRIRNCTGLVQIRGNHRNYIWLIPLRFHC